MGLSILFHTRSTGGGGAERVVAQLGAGLARRGHRVTLAVDLIDPAVPAIEGVELVALEGGHIGQTRALAALIRARRPDVAVAALGLSVTKLTLARLAAFRRVPLILSYHGYEEHRLGWLSHAAYRGLPLLSRLAAKIVAVSDGLAEELIKRWGAAPARTVRVYNPVAVEGETPDASAIRARGAVVGFVGRLAPEKSLPDLLAAITLINRPDLKVLVGGDGPERPVLEAEIARLGLKDCVQLLGAVSSSAEVFGRAAVAVLPSRSEAFGLVIVEALHLGLSVVATDCGGPREILEGGRHGALVPPGDPSALARAIEAALEGAPDPAARAARAADFSLEKGIDAWEALITAAART